MSTEEALRILAIYQAWRTGADERVFDELGITTCEITEAINTGIEALKRKDV